MSQNLERLSDSPVAIVEMSPNVTDDGRTGCGAFKWGCGERRTLSPAGRLPGSPHRRPWSLPLGARYGDEA